MPAALTPPLNPTFPSRPVLAAALAVLMLGGSGAARAQDDLPTASSVAGPVEVDADALPSTDVDPTVFATLLPNPDVDAPSVLQSAVFAALAPRPDAARLKPIVPATPAVNPALKPMALAPGALVASPSTVPLDAGQLVQVYANGLPGANAPDSHDPLARVMPRAVNPSDVAAGARWAAEDKIKLPLLSDVAVDTHADVIYGAPPPRAANVRRSLRLTAQWDDPADFTFGITPGLERGGGNLYMHHVTGIQASTLDKTQSVKWKSFIEVSGEKLGQTSLIDNSTAQVQAGASWLPTPALSLDVSVRRGTLTTVNDFSSSVGLSAHF